MQRSTLGTLGTHTLLFTPYLLITIDRSYSPASRDKAVPLVAVTTRRADYSHVKAKVYSGGKHGDDTATGANKYTERVSVCVATKARCYSDGCVDRNTSSGS